MKNLKITTPLVIITLVVIICVGAYLVYALVIGNQPVESDPINTITENVNTVSDIDYCTNQDARNKIIWDKTHFSGEIVLKFNEDVTENQAINMIESNNLKVNLSYYKTREIFVNVPEGSEIQWVCRFKDNPNISEAHLYDKPQITDGY